MLLACWQSHRSIALDFFFATFLPLRTARAFSPPAEPWIRAAIAWRERPFDEERSWCKGILERNRLSTGVFTFDLREQRRKPQRQIVVARIKRADNDNWLVISHCIIQWNTMER